MSARKKAAILSLTILGATSLGLWVYSNQLDDQHHSLVADQVEVVKAARTMPAGTPLTKERLTTEKVPRRFLPPNPLLESELNIYLGTPVAVKVEEGAMLLTSDFSVAALMHPMTFASPLVIKSARLTLEHEEPRAASEAALRLVSEHGGYIVSSELSYVRRQNTQRFAMVARIPAARFEAALLSSRELGTTTEEWVKGAGVTEEVRELEAKIGVEVIREGEQDDAGSSAVAELKVEADQLERQVAMSAIEITIAQPRPEPPPEPAPPTIGDEFEEAFRTSARTLMSVAFLLMRGLAALLPVALFASPAILAGAMWHRRRRR